MSDTECISSPAASGTRSWNASVSTRPSRSSSSVQARSSLGRSLAPSAELISELELQPSATSCELAVVVYVCVSSKTRVLAFDGSSST